MPGTLFRVNSKKNLQYVFRYSLILLAVSILYLKALPWKTLDSERFLIPWLEHILANGPLRSLGDEFSNYSPPYLYALSAASLLFPLVPKLYVIKIVSIAGSVGLSISFYWLIRRYQEAWPSLLAATALLFLPTVWLNGPFWGQCDAFWATTDVVALAAAVRGRWVVMAVAIGIAISIKLQAIFMAPVMLYLLASGRMPWRVIPFSALAYFTMLVPAWLAGRSAWSLLSVYSGQAQTYSKLSKSAPNLWIYIEALDLVSYPHGIIIGGASGVIACAFLLYLGQHLTLKQSPSLVNIALFAAIALPYVLPKMHNRYFFLADVLSYASAVINPNPRTWKIALLVQFGSVLACSHYLFHLPGGVPIGTLFITGAVVLVSQDILAALRTTHPQPRNPNIIDVSAELSINRGY